MGIDDQKPCGARYAAEGRTQDQGDLDSRSALEACDDDILRLAIKPCLFLFPANGRASGDYLGLY